MEREAIRFKGGVLELLDQTKLPHKVDWMGCRTCAETIQAIKGMKVRGAPAIGIAGAYAVVQAYNENNPDAVIEIEKARPTAADLRNAVQFMQRRIKNGAEPLKCADEWAKLIEEKCNKISENGAWIIQNGDAVLTHCNTGFLATNRYGTALGAIKRAWTKGKEIFVYVCETRPRMQGSLTSWELKEYGVPHKVIVDSAAGGMMKRGKVKLVLVGADRIARNGDFAGKIGAYSLAVLAKENKIPFYVLAPFSTFDLLAGSGAGIGIEERVQEEVLEVRGARVYAEGVEAENPAFDVTPSELVSGYVTEFGIHRKPTEFERIWRNMEE